MNTERARLVESGFPVSGLMKYLTSLVFSCDVIKIMPLFISAFIRGRVASGGCNSLVQVVLVSVPSNVFVRREISS